MAIWTDIANDALNTWASFRMPKLDQTKYLGEVLDAFWSLLLQDYAGDEAWYVYSVLPTGEVMRQAWYKNSQRMHYDKICKPASECPMIKIGQEAWDRMLVDYTCVGCSQVRQEYRQYVHSYQGPNAQTCMSCEYERDQVVVEDDFDYDYEGDTDEDYEPEERECRCCGSLVYSLGSAYWLNHRNEPEYKKGFRLPAGTKGHGATHYGFCGTCQRYEASAKHTYTRGGYYKLALGGLAPTIATGSDYNGLEPVIGG